MSLRQAAEAAFLALKGVDKYLTEDDKKYAEWVYEQLRQALAQEQETKRDGDSEFLAGVEWAAKTIEAKLKEKNDG